LWYQQSLKHILLFYFLLPSLPFLPFPPCPISVFPYRESMEGKQIIFFLFIFRLSEGAAEHDWDV
jgi:hypothetical protein